MATHIGVPPAAAFCRHFRIAIAADPGLSQAIIYLCRLGRVEVGARHNSVIYLIKLIIFDTHSIIPPLLVPDILE